MITPHHPRLDLTRHAAAPFAAMVRMEKRIQLDPALRFEPDELAHLLLAIGAINLWNRVVIAAGTLPASYVKAAA